MPAPTGSAHPTPSLSKKPLAPDGTPGRASSVVVRARWFFGKGRGGVCSPSGASRRFQFVSDPFGVLAVLASKRVLNAGSTRTLVKSAGHQASLGCQRWPLRCRPAAENGGEATEGEH